MDGGDGAVPDADAFVDHLHNGGEAVGGAACGCHQMVGLRVVEVVVHAIDDVQRAAVLDRGGHDHLARARVEVGPYLGACLEHAVQSITRSTPISAKGRASMVFSCVSRMRRPFRTTASAS
jgi:hypothetical protein